MNITVSQPFPFEIEGLGTIMDYVEDRFLFIVKDEFWSEEEKAMLMQEPMEVALYYRYDVAVFLVSGGDIDTSDFYFNVQECEWKEQLLSSTTLQASLRSPHPARQGKYRVLPQGCDFPEGRLTADHPAAAGTK